MIIDDIQDYQQKWNQHVLRMPENRLPRKSLQYQPQSKRDLGRPVHVVAERELITQNYEWKKKKKIMIFLTHHSTSNGVTETKEYIETLTRGSPRPLKGCRVIEW